ncbi:serine carboxypeptidase S28 [Ancylostoma ceylanicum]|uniref:Serine carboxypeptidase S28 n=1 Tax=Ancylostoma ceylanicum TaxID=53326 RepID=A0A0D6M1Q2_9BILA|nr:serine carboxypeptidase S28 [Ancylostoma ceylanicum]
MAGDRMAAAISPRKANVPVDSSGVGPSQVFFQQKLDHFKAGGTTMWPQRYFYNFQYRVSGSNVIFLMIGGESPEDINWVSNEDYPFVQYAKKFGAAMFSLEHRFYGQSQPTPNQSVKNLAYLSSRQAIEDVAYFIRSMNEKHKFKDPKWITFGGSYSGALSLWVRQAYPDLITGAVGSSAPLNAELDFWGENTGYLQVVEDALRSHSNDCAENVRKGFEKVESLMQSKDGRQKLTDLFVLKPPFTKLKMTYNDIQTFYVAIFGNFQGAVQYSGDNAGSYKNGYGIPEVCKIMNNKSNEPIMNLQLVNIYMSSMYGPFQHTDISYDDMITYLKKEQFGDSLDFDSSARSWTWQTCTEFGYFQTTGGGPKGIFGSGTPLTLYLNLCSDVFGPAFNSSVVKSAVHSTQMHYGGADRYKGTNVVIPNGSIDPWHALGKYTSNDKSVVWYLINGTAHCAEMYPPSPKDKPGLTRVRKIIERNIGIWLSNSPRTNRGKTIKNEAKTWSRPKERAPLTAQELRAAPKKPIEFTKMVSASAVPPPEFETGYFTQPVDHFDNQNPDTFLQKYYKNSQWAKEGGPNFIMIGGEGPQSSRWVINENITYLVWAKKFGATVYALEHRYYGDSIRTVNLRDENDPNPDLTYLSSIQMLYDVANFIRNVNFNTNNTAPWIAFGGSYPGCLALWMRQMFPELVLGAVGSSAPVEAKLDFYEYLEVVEKAIRTYSKTCADNVAKGFAEMHELALTKAGRKKLSDIFTLKPAWTEKTDVTPLDLQFFFSNIYGQFQGAVQYSGDNTGAYAHGYGIPDMCKYMNNNTNTPIQNIAKFNEYMTIFYSGEKNFTGTENSYPAFINQIKMSQKNGPSAGAMLLWTWQTCTEFGYFQSSDSGYSIFGSPTPVNLFTRMCTDLFGEQYTAVAVQRSINKINQLYGGIDFYHGTNVVIPNGSIDPWHALGKYTSNDSSVVMHLIEGTAHCAEMYPARPQDPPDLTKTRKLIEENIGKWLKSGPVTKETTKAATTTPTTPTTPGTSATRATSETPIVTTEPTTETTTTSARGIFTGFTLIIQFLMALVLVSL